MFYVKLKIANESRLIHFGSFYVLTWEQRQLGQILTGTYNGQTPSREVRTFWNGGIPWLTSGELNRGHVLSTIEKISKAGLDAANLRIIPKNTFVIVHISA